MEYGREKYSVTKKDIILIGVFVLLLAVNIVYQVQTYGLDRFAMIVEQAIIFMLAFVGLIEVASYIGWTPFVPDFFRFERNRRRKDEMRNFMHSYFENDINFVRDYDEERINYIITQLGISVEQLDEIRFEIIKMRDIRLQNLDDARKKINCILKCEHPIIIDQKKFDSSKLEYTKVDYYINLPDAMFMRDFARECSSLLHFLITNTEKLNLLNINRIVIPYDSNFLLGVEVGKKLGKSIVKMRHEKGKIITDQPWEGELNPADKVIVIHDVLVTAEQVIDAILKLPPTCSVSGVYCLIARKESDGVKRLRDMKIPVYKIADIGDDDIRAIREGCE